MKKHIHSKIFLSLLCMTIVLSICPLSSATDSVNTNTHKELMIEYIKDIRSVQNDIFLLFQKIAGVSPTSQQAINSEVDLIYNKLEQIQTSVLDYVADLPRLSAERRDILFVLIALNSTENSLYQLKNFTNQTNSLARTLLLEDFYFLRTSTTQTLNRLENIILRE